MAATSKSVTPIPPERIKTEDDPVVNRILALCSESHGRGVTDRLLQTTLTDVESQDRARAINRLLSENRIELFRSRDQGLVYKLVDVRKAMGTAKIKGDAEEKLVYGIIAEAGNKGTWIRDIRTRSNLVQTQLSRVLKSLIGKKLIKDVKCVNSSRKIVYMLYELEPDQSVTGGAWYSNQDFESEFVDVLHQQCYFYLQDRLHKTRAEGSSLLHQGPLAVRNASMASSKEVLEYIVQLGISKIRLRVEDIESILDTLVYDAKVERKVSSDGVRHYRAVEPLLPTSGLMRVPCGGCPISKNCSMQGVTVSPTKCIYMKEWLSL